MEITKYLLDYENFIIKFENALKEKYQIKDDIYEYIGTIVKKNDFFDNYQYNFHGAGCKFTINNIVCEYDFSLDENSKYQFSLWKLKTFIESFYQNKIDDIELRKFLEDLVSKNLLRKLIIGEKVFDIYLLY
ncbi:DUF6896 domain-containing protein [Chryseobacterium gleum]|jgi:hypothetical protein|uniref:DUF6896 domain-containing protein n=1 Tax=Chryseobacterium gleum TaxID=250 RepID=UPI00241D7836|nr:hypothetical protein [Chryseobacterium gleum]